MNPEDLEKYNFKSNIRVSELTLNKHFKEKVLIERVNQTYCTPTSEQQINPEIETKKI
jgi:hypothetical protein